MEKKFTNISLIVIDVDGTMTDGGIYYDNHGNELKKFCTKDAAGFFAAHDVGIKTMILTGRKCPAVEKRASELKVDYLVQNVKDKYTYLKQFMQEQEIDFDEMAYIGDDLNDLAVMKLAYYSGCPKDACIEIIDIAEYVSSVKGGYGAVRDIICDLLKRRGEWENAIHNVYMSGV